MWRWQHHETCVVWCGPQAVSALLQAEQQHSVVTMCSVVVALLHFATFLPPWETVKDDALRERRENYAVRIVIHWTTQQCSHSYIIKLSLVINYYKINYCRTSFSCRFRKRHDDTTNLWEIVNCLCLITSTCCAAYFCHCHYTPNKE